MTQSCKTDPIHYKLLEGGRGGRRVASLHYFRYGCTVSTGSTGDTSPTITTTMQSDSPVTSSSSPVPIIAAMIVVVIVIVVVFIILCLGRKQGKTTLDPPRNRNVLGVGTLQKEAGIEMTGQVTCETVDDLGNNMVGKSFNDEFGDGKIGLGGIYDDIDHEGFILGISTYEVIDKKRYLKNREPGGKDPYNVLGEDHKPTLDIITQDTRSK